LEVVECFAGVECFVVGAGVEGDACDAGEDVGDDLSEAVDGDVGCCEDGFAEVLRYLLVSP